MAVAGEVCTDGSRPHAPAPATARPPGRRPAAGGRRRRRRHHPGARAVPLRAPPTARARSPATPGTPRCSPAGSSGGSAAAVAAGLRAARARQRRHGLAAAARRRLRPGHAQAGPRRGPGRASARTAGRAWPRTAPWRRRSPTSPWRTAVLAGEDAGRARRPAAGRCGSPSPPGRRCPACALDAAGAGRRRRGRRRAARRPGTPSSAARSAGHRPARRSAAVARWIAGADDDAEALRPRPRGAAAAQPRRTPGSARLVRRAGLVRPRTARAVPRADGRLLRRRRRAAHARDHRAAAARPAVARARLPRQRHGQHPVGAVAVAVEPRRPAGAGAARPAPRRGRAAHRRPVRRPCRAPKRDYSGWPESWSACSRGAATRRSSIPGATPVAAPV